jgi:spermidine synthase
MRIALAAIGFASTIAQVVLMRELVATLYGNELLFGIVLTAWLAWVAVGSFSGRLAERLQWGTGAFAGGLVLAAALFPAQIALVRGVRTLLGVTPGALVEFGPMVGAVVLILAPLCLLTGFLFTLGTRLTVERGGGTGQAYVWESAGGVVGGVLFSFVLIRWLDPFQTALAVGAVNLVIAINLWLSSSVGKYENAAALSAYCSSPRARGMETAATAAKLSCFLLPVLLLAAFLLGSHLHAVTLSWQWSDLVFAADSPYGRLTVQARDGQRVFFENGVLAFETQGTFPEEVAHFPLLAHPNPREVLLIGGGVAGDVREILKHPVDHVTYVELDPLLIEAAQAHLPPEDAAILNDPRVTLALADGRLYVKTTQRTFDVIILDLPEPSTGALNRFYTHEFFAEARAALNPGGVFALGLPSAENYWSPELAQRNGSVYHTLRAVFLEVVVLPGEHNFFLSSAFPLEINPAVLAGRLAERGVETRWVTPGYVEYVLTTDRFAAVRAELEASEVRLNEDLTPICYYYNLALWLSRFYPGLWGAFESVSLVNPPASSGQAVWWVVVPLALIVLLVRWQRQATVPFAIATVGLAEMTLEIVILFAFQVLHGTVYAQVSLIVTAFMAGLALGGAGGQRLASSDRNARRALIAIQGGVVVYSGVFPFILSLPIPVPTLVFPLLALLAGLLTGMAFPLAVTLMRGSASRAAGLLYGADLVGGCFGALLGAVFLVPVLGIPQTCAVVALVGLVGLLVL